LVKRDSKTASHDHVLSLSKLKTLEYRIFRKMREKLRNNFKRNVANDGTKKGPLISSFKKEILELSHKDKFSLPRPFDWYISLFETAFEFIT